MDLVKKPLETKTESTDNEQSLDPKQSLDVKEPDTSEKKLTTNPEEKSLIANEENDNKESVDEKQSLDAKRKNVVNNQLHSDLWQKLQKYLLTAPQLKSNGYPREHPTDPGRAVVKWNRWEEPKRSKALRLKASQRSCDRCTITFTVDKDGRDNTKQKCVYHYGRANKRKEVYHNYGDYDETTYEHCYSCCGKEQWESGCQTVPYHVAETFDPFQLTGFVRTPKSNESTPERVYALDTEMVFTKLGRELARVTLIGPDMKVVYDEFVKPEDPIIDYNTRMSGIRVEDMLTVTISLSEVQDALLEWIKSSTVIIGHSLENDLRSLKLFHDSVVDTSVAFPKEPGYKYGLKQLASDYLNKDIQTQGLDGHDSTEDAKTCMELMIWKMKNDNPRTKYYRP